MKTTLSIFLHAAFAVLLLSGCGLSSNPESTVEEYLEAKTTGWDPNKSYEMLSSDDKKYLDREDYLLKQEGVEEILPLMEELSDYYSVEVIDTRSEDDKIYVTVRETEPALEGIAFELVHGWIDLVTLGLTPVEERREIVRTRLIEYFEKNKGRDIPTRTSTNVYTLVEEEDGYKIFLNLGEGERNQDFSVQRD